MQVCLTILGAEDLGSVRRVRVNCESGATAADLARELGAGQLLVDGQNVDPDVRIGMPPLLRGATVTLAATSTARRATGGPVGVASALAPWELWVIAGPDIGMRFPLRFGRTVLGRSHSTGAPLTDANVSRHHAEVEVTPSQVTIRDLGGVNGSWLAGHRLTSTPEPWTEADVLDAGSSRLVLRPTPRPARTSPDGQGHLLIASSGRAVDDHDPGEVSFPDLPPKATRSRLPVLALVLPLALAAVLAVALRSPTMLLFGLTAPLLAVATWVSERRRGSRVTRDGRSQHRAEQEAAGTRLSQAVAAEQTALEAAFPPLAAVLTTVEARGAALWAKRPTYDRLPVRIGTGRRRSSVRLIGDTAPSAPTLFSVPITLDLAELGVVGICGDRRRVTSLVGAILARLLVAYAPRELEVHVLAEGDGHTDHWDWLGLVPHVTRTDVHSGSVALSRMVAERRLRSPTDQSAEPLVVTVVDARATAQPWSALRDVLRTGRAVGVVVVAVTETRDRLPGECVSELVVGPDGARLRSPDDSIGDVAPDLPSTAWLARLGSALAPLRDHQLQDVGGAIPDEVRLLDLLDNPSNRLAANVERRWRQGLPTTHVPLGSRHDGPLFVDLEAEGPHALIGGTTGSGKSELLQTLVCSLALANRPDEVVFVLVDYKGGAAFRRCAELAHVVGLVTDLDTHLTRRALVSLSAELRRRERLLSEFGVADLFTYLRRREEQRGRPEQEMWPPLARLVLVIDEFRVLAEELPDFVHGLVRLAAVGRSLGVHLVLATQRPGGVVTPDIRANVSLRIALRMRDRADSVDVIETAEAAAIPASRPGRAYLRGATFGLTEFQTARVSSSRRTPARLTVTPADRAWRPLPSSEPLPITATESAPPDIDAIVAATRSVASSMQIEVPPAPWLPPLPDHVDLASLDAFVKERRHGYVPLGLADHPDDQAQTAWCWSPSAGHLGIAGGPRSGRTTAGLSVAGALARAFSPGELHLYAIGSPALSALTVLPHTAAFASVDDAEHVALVMDAVRAEVIRRTREASLAKVAPMVLLVDGWESLANLDNGSLAAQLRLLLDAGRSMALSAVVTGARAVLAGQLTSVLSERIVLRLGDSVDFALAGIPARSVPVHQPPGRAIEVATLRELQLGQLAPDPASTAAALQAIAQRWSTEPDVGLPPRPVRRLPQDVALRECRAAPGTVALGVRDGDLAVCGFSPAAGERRLVVVGPPGSGRTTVLAMLAIGLAGIGLPVAVVGEALGERTHRQTVLALTGREATDRDQLVHARRAQPNLAVLVDDAERLVGTAIQAVLLEITRLVDEDGGVVVAATTGHGLESRASPLTTELARARTGVLLNPPHGSHLLGVSFQTTSPLHPGRGWLVTPRGRERVQVARPP